MLGGERGCFFRVVLVVCLFGLDSPSPIPLSMLQIIPQFNDQNNKQYYVSYVLWVRKSWLGSWAVLRMLSLPGTCPGLQDLLPRWRTPMVGRTMPVVDGRPQSLCRWAFPQHCPGILTWRLVAFRAIYPKEQSRNYTLDDSAWESHTVTSPPDVEHRDRPRSVWEEITERHTYQEDRIIPRGKGHWGSPWRLEAMLLLPLYLWWAEEWPPKDSRFSFWNQCHLTWKKDFCRCDEVKNIEIEDYPGLSRSALNKITMIL